MEVGSGSSGAGGPARPPPGPGSVISDDATEAEPATSSFADSPHWLITANGRDSATWRLRPSAPIVFVTRWLVSMCARLAA